MTAKAKAAKKQDAYRTILLDMLKEPENKVCGDCGAKGPRWASWNIGVFVCIRCAGIHRNLGVHISKMKSVNLDTWTEEQIESISAKGNGVVNDFYECNMPESMRRPVDDYSAETFIRAKYEQKKFIPRRSPADSSGKPKEKKEKKPRQSPAPVKKAPVKTVKTTVTQPPKQQPRHLSKSPAPISQPPAPSKPAPDLLGAAPSPANVATSKPSVDLLFMGSDGANSSGQMASAAGNPAVSQQKHSIMSLYGAQQQQQQYPGFVGQQQQARMMPAAGQMGMGSYGANPMSVYTQQQLQYQQMQQQQFLQAQQVQQQMARLRLEQQQGQHGSLMGGMGNSGGWPSPVQQRNMTATTGHTMSNQLWQ